VQGDDLRGLGREGFFAEMRVPGIGSTPGVLAHGISAASRLNHEVTLASWACLLVLHADQL
jgi:hypothetical protein